MPALEVRILDVVVYQAEVVTQLDGRGTRQRGVVVAGQRVVRQQPEERSQPLATGVTARIQAQVICEHLVQRPGVSAARYEDPRHLAIYLHALALNLDTFLLDGRIPYYR